jgi:YHS domain-containing protein
MNGKARLVKYSVVALVSMSGMFILLAGCQKEKPMVGTGTTKTKAQETTASSAKHEATPAGQQAVQVAEQTTCPVMGGAINKDIFVEYKGKKVYFCCNGCPDTFKANPEKYISKLPQFAK